MTTRGPGFQKPSTSAKQREVAMPVISNFTAVIIGCSCGWAYAHPREKVRENAAQRHLDKQHGGQGLWL